MEDPTVAKFIDSEAHSKAVEFVHGVVLRGLDPNNVDSALLNKYTETDNFNHVINTIAIAIGMISYDGVQVEDRIVKKGNVNLSDAKIKSQLEELVGQLPVGDSPRYRFVLIPLALGAVIDKKWETSFSLLVKTQSRAGDNCYVDMSGRVYQSFRKFLINNKFPLAVLCYPSDGKIELDYSKHVKLSYAVVGKGEARLAKMDKFVVEASIVSLISCPALVPLFALYSGVRGVMELVDCYQHETLNPLKFPHTIIYWTKVVVCFSYFTIRGIQFFSSLGKKVLGTLETGTLVEAGSIEWLLTTTNVGLTTIELLTKVNSWNNMILSDRTKLAFSLCYQNRLPPSLENGERVLESGRFATLCNTVKNLVLGSFNPQAFKELVYDMSTSCVKATVAALLYLIWKLTEHNLSVELSEDFVTIKIGDHKLNFQNLLGLTSDELGKLGNLFDQLDGDLKTLRSKLGELFGDGIAVNLIQ